MKRVAIIAACLLALAGCKHKETTVATATAVDYGQVAVPDFSADSAYQYVASQLAFGNRTPGSPAWERCGQWIAAQMGRWCDTVVVQDFHTTLWDGRRVPGRNIVASTNPSATRRVLLAAHWDSRLWADHDPDEANQRKPVPGANDGASGAAVLMEMARANGARCTRTTPGARARNTGPRTATRPTTRPSTECCSTWWAPTSPGSPKSR